MRTVFFFLVAAALLALSSCSRTTAGVTIPAQERFILGEYMQEAYTAKLTNQGSRSVTVLVVDKQDRSTARNLPLESGERTELLVEPAYEVHLQNSTNRNALVFVEMSKNVPGMRYVAHDQSGEQPGIATDERTFEPVEGAGPAKASLWTTIPVGQQLVVGEGTSAVYNAKINARGDIKVSVRDKETGAQTQGFGMRGTQRITVRKHEDVYLVNTSSEAVTVRMSLSEPVSGERLEVATEPSGK